MAEGGESEREREPSWLVGETSACAARNPTSQRRGWRPLVGVATGVHRIQRMGDPDNKVHVMVDIVFTLLAMVASNHDHE